MDDKIKEDLPIEVQQAFTSSQPEAFWEKQRASVMEKISPPVKKPWLLWAPAMAAGLILFALTLNVFRPAQPVIPPQEDWDLLLNLEAIENSENL